MTETEEKKMNAIWEAVVIVVGLNELILRLESERTQQQDRLYQDSIMYIKMVRSKYYQLAKTPMTVDESGNIVPIISEDDQVSGE